MNGARAAVTARPVHVEEHGTIAFGEVRSVESRERPANRIEHTSRHVSGNDRIRHARQPAVPEVNIGAADFRTRGPEQRRRRTAAQDGETRGSQSAAAAPA